MLKISAHVAPSIVHGTGLFARKPIKAGTVLWAFKPRKDHRRPLSAARDVDLHFGYINPRRSTEFVICGDIARWWNFAPAGIEPNSIEGAIDRHGEGLIIAARDIAANEELLIDPATDADAARKLTPAKAA